MPRLKRAEGAVDDPLLDASALNLDQKRYLLVLGEVGMPYVAMRQARKRYGMRMSTVTLTMWRQESPEFEDLYQTLRREYWDAFAGQNIEMARTGKVQGGAAMLLMQQLRRAIPEEYEPAVVQNVHQTVTYRVEGDFQPPADAPTAVAVVVQPPDPSKVN